MTRTVSALRLVRSPERIRPPSCRRQRQHRRARIRHCRYWRRRRHLRRCQWPCELLLHWRGPCWRHSDSRYRLSETDSVTLAILQVVAPGTVASLRSAAENGIAVSVQERCPHFGVFIPVRRVRCDDHGPPGGQLAKSLIQLVGIHGKPPGLVLTKVSASKSITSGRLAAR
jgi:hypothetical protein